MTCVLIRTEQARKQPKKKSNRRPIPVPHNQRQHKPVFLGDSMGKRLQQQNNCPNKKNKKKSDKFCLLIRQKQNQLISS
jgi:hypothetical protein